jgi:predicted HicB family RNase H-like nuclease
MGFVIEKSVKLSRTFRLDKKLLDKLYEISYKNNISLNRLVVLCLEYAIENLEEK